MIEIKLKTICENHRFTIQKIHEGTRINRNTLTYLYYGKIKRIDIETLDRLCLFFNNYFPCKISDILEFKTH